MLYNKPRKNFVFITGLGLVLQVFAACGLQVQSQKSTPQALPYNQQQKLLDFDTAVDYFKNYYAPLKYKERSLKIDSNEVFSTLREAVKATKTNHEFHQVLARLAATFQDGHISLQIPSQRQYRLPFQIDYIDGQFVVLNTFPFLDPLDIRRGDTLVSIDGQSPQEIVEILKQFHNFGYHLYNQRLLSLLITRRLFLKPNANRSRVVFKRQRDGAHLSVDLPWHIIDPTWSKEERLPSLRQENELITQFDQPALRTAASEQLGLGGTVPFFINGKNIAKFKFTTAQLTRADIAPFDIENIAEVFAATYEYQGKKVLIIRIPKYPSGDTKILLGTYRAILTKYHSLVDVLVIDQTRNPGGSASLVEDLAKLFLTKPGPSVAFAPRADYKWLRKFEALEKSIPAENPWMRTIYRNIFDDIDAANESGQFLAPPINLVSFSAIVGEGIWTKPILLLIDELSGSGGDMFPLIMKSHGRAVLFGNRTAGMGGNVESMPELPFSGITISMTRSLFYLHGDENTANKVIIENNGVSPHIQHQVSMEDFLGEYAEYIDKFSQAAIELLPKPTPLTEEPKINEESATEETATEETATEETATEETPAEETPSATGLSNNNDESTTGDNTPIALADAAENEQ